MVICWEYQSVWEPNQDPSGISLQMRKLPADRRSNKITKFLRVNF